MGNGTKFDFPWSSIATFTMISPRFSIGASIFMMFLETEVEFFNSSS